MTNHKLLKEQLEKANLTESSLPNNAENWQYFLNLVDTAYSENDQNCYTMNRTIEISSNEMHALNDVLKAEISEIKEKEALLKEERIFLTEVIDSIPDLFLCFDVQGKTIRWNKNAELVSGYSFEELSKINVLDFFEEADKIRVNKYLQKIILDGWGTFETSILCKDLTKIPCALSGKLSNYKEGKCIIGVAHDISQQKAAESKLIERIEELSRWHDITLNREERILELKHDVNQLLLKTGHPPRYPSVESDFSI